MEKGGKRRDVGYTDRKKYKRKEGVKRLRLESPSERRWVVKG